jgi:HEAT repeat protein
MSEKIGEDNICAGIELYINDENGGELALCVLRFLRPWSAMNICYNIIRNDDNTRRRRHALEILEDISDARVIPWVPGFLYDPDGSIQRMGAFVIENLFLGCSVPRQELEETLDLMRKHSDPVVLRSAAFIDSFGKAGHREKRLPLVDATSKVGNIYEDFTNDNRTGVTRNGPYDTSNDFRIAEMINWSRLEDEILPPDKSYGNGTARKFLAKIVEEPEFRSGIELYVNGEPGGELARCVLRCIRPWPAMKVCYDIFKNDDAVKRRINAVEMLQIIGDLQVVPWVKDFLQDPDDRIQEAGAGIIERLFKDGYVARSHIKGALTLMRKHSNREVVKKAGSIDHLERLRNREHHMW